MGLPVPLRNASDAYVSEKYPSKNFNSAARLYVSDNSAADTRYSYIYFGIPSGMSGATVQSAVLRLYSGGGFPLAGSQTVTVSRLGSKFSVNRVNWTNRPSVAGPVKSMTKNNPPGGTPWEFDVKDVIQQIADGAAWYGFRITSTGSQAKWFHSAQSPIEAYRPTLEITWSDAPDQPESLIPDGAAVSVDKPTLRWDFIDPRGDTTMQGFDLRLFSTKALADANGAGDLLDLQNQANDIPQWDLDATAYGGIAADATIWWRVRNIDGVGLKSDWSDPASITRTSKGTLTITNPAAGASPFVEESTPPLSWTFTGRTQESYEVIVTTPETPENYIWTSGVVTSTDVAVTPPSGVLTEVGKTYRLIIRIYDTVTRSWVPDDAPYVEQTRDFTYNLSSTVTAPSALTATPDTFRPRMLLEWTRATAPDTFVIFRGTKQIAERQPSDLLVSGTTYQFRDDEPLPRTDYTWSVGAKVNGKVSSGNPTATGKVKPITTTLSETDGDRCIYLFNPDTDDVAKAELSDVHYPLGNASPVLITQSLRGYEGSAGGVLLSNTVPNVTAAGQLADLNYFKNNPGLILKLVWVDKVLRVVIRNVTDRPIANPNGTVEYAVKFDLFEVF